MVISLSILTMNGEDKSLLEKGKFRSHCYKNDVRFSDFTSDFQLIVQHHVLLYLWYLHILFLSCLLMRIIFKTFSYFSWAIMNFTPSWIYFHGYFDLFSLKKTFKGVDFWWFFFWQLKVGIWMNCWNNKHLKELYHYNIQFLALFFISCQL